MIFYTVVPGILLKQDSFFNLNLKRGETHDKRKKVSVGYEQYDVA